MMFRWWRSRWVETRLLDPRTVQGFFLLHGLPALPAALHTNLIGLRFVQRALVRDGRCFDLDVQKLKDLRWQAAEIHRHRDGFFDAFKGFLVTELLLRRCTYERNLR